MKLMWKLPLIGLLLLVLGVPVMMLQGLVWERQQRGREVAEDIARSSSRAQLVVGPLLRVAIERKVRKVRMVGEGVNLRSETQIEREWEHRLLTPTLLDVDGKLGSERRRRGLFEAVVYHADLALDAQFAPVPLAPPGEDVVEQRITDAALVLGLGDARGVRAVQATLDGAALQVEPGTGIEWQPVGLQLPVDPHSLQAPLRLRMKLDLAGTESLQWLPSGDDTHVALRGDWPHPSFIGQFLPNAPEVSATGFGADWKVSRLAAQTPRALRDCGVSSPQCNALHEGGFGLRLVDPVDRYLKTDRAIKYAWLFIVLVFGALFFVELLRPIRVHPLQYGLTGLALAIFFLLLLSMSEHIGFGPAYLLAAGACVGLVSVYMAQPFGSRGRALGFGALLSGLYGLLYGLLQSEDYALLMGALALFGLLAAAMLLTRRLDWYRLGSSEARSTAPS
jgi:inner membrane protein